MQMENRHITDFSRELNREQLQAVETLEGPVLVVAGAGSGKTRTLVYRVARLIDHGIDPASILLLTFTRKAAQEMLTRAAKLVGEASHSVAGGTFHAFSHRMLRKYAHYAGYPCNFTIMDRGDVQSLMNMLAREMKLAGPGTGKKFPGKSALASMSSRMANTGFDTFTLVQRQYPHLENIAGSLDMLFTAYGNYKKKHALMDYDDLLNVWRDILKEHEDVRKSVGEQYNFIMVDEYQDTNAAQADIIRLISETHGNVMAVGDDAQSIYSFRGATIRNILDFPKLFSGVRIIKLEKNYRSTQPNLDCTNTIIANASDKFAKRLVAQRKGGVKPVLFRAMDEQEQAGFVAGEIRDMLAQGSEPSEIAVLFRAGFHSYSLETALKYAGIPFEKRGGIKLVEAAHVKDILSIMRLLINPFDKISFNRMTTLLEGIGPKTSDRIFAEIIKTDTPFREMASWKCRSKWMNPLREAGRLLMELEKRKNDIAGNLEVAIEWYKPLLERNHPEDYPTRLQELQQLRVISERYDFLEEMLADLSIDPPEHAGEDNSDKIVLSTIHSAKGLEWKTVFIISLAEGRMPSPAATKLPGEIEEERRLFYVAATRAKDFLFFCVPAFINLHGAGLIPASPSRFIEELPESLFETRSRTDMDQNAGQTGAGKVERRYASDKQDNTSFPPGCRVRHPVFGRGTVTSVLGPLKIKVMFDVGGVKTLRTDYASLSKLSG